MQLIFTYNNRQKEVFVSTKNGIRIASINQENNRITLLNKYSNGIRNLGLNISYVKKQILNTYIEYEKAKKKNNTNTFNQND